MARAGYCSDCGRNVFLDDGWACENGHAWSRISDWYDTETGEKLTPYWLEGTATEAVAPAPARAGQTSKRTD